MKNVRLRTLFHGHRQRQRETAFSPAKIPATSFGLFHAKSRINLMATLTERILMNLELIDKTALISGSTKGIGFAIASQLAAEGASVIMNGRSDQAVDSALEQVRKAVPKAKVEGFAGDLATVTATEDLLKLFPAVDILVNNLGIYEPRPFDAISDEDWRHIFEV